MISLIIPVYNESENLPYLLGKVSDLPISKDIELIIVDDSYDDLTLKSTEPFKNKLKINYIHRKKRLGLASAVIDGFSAAGSATLVCLDGDGSHPVEKIEELAEKIEAGNAMALASRNVPGGGADEQWSSVRKFISWTCNLLVKPLTGLKDPMSGYFAVSKDFFDTVKPQLKP
ncbi:MAG: glycosyltransferase, partial [Lentisphaeraceae bacterium]|nr:glycosyltransferase [Lentisphaeraceae bacterium]